MFSLSSTIKKKGISTYIFVICNSLKKNVEKVKKIFEINKIPSTFFGNYSLKTDFEKILYLDKYKIIFYGINEKVHCASKNLYDTYGKIGKKMSDNNDEKGDIFIVLTGDNLLLIKNQIISYILGYYNFDEFN